MIFLRPLRAEDAADHLAGEDSEMAKWLSGGRSTLANVEAYIEQNLENWRIGAPRRAFGVFDCATSQLVGNIEVNLVRTLEPDQVMFLWNSSAMARAWPGTACVESHE